MVDYGQQLVDADIKKDLIRKIIYHGANLLSVGVKLAPETPLDVLDVKFNYPSSMSGKYPVADDAIAPREKITWSKFTLALQKAQVHYFITDSAKLRAVSGTQNTINARRASETLAKLKDDEIMEVLYGGAAGSVTAGALWTSASADIETDIVTAWNGILDNSNVTMDELKNLALVVPTKAFAKLNTLKLIGNVQQTIKDYIGQSFSITVFPTRTTKLGSSSSTDALLMVMGNLTAQHGVLSNAAASAAGVPLVESERVMGSGDDYLVSQWYRTVIIDDGVATTGTNYRIYKIAGVCS